MKNILALSVIGAALMAPVTASAASTAQLKLMGTITPSACVPNFVGGGTIDYGNIPAGTLSVTTATNLPTKRATLNIICDSPMKFGVVVVDERAASNQDTINVADTIPAGAKFGLGFAGNGAKIGTYSMWAREMIADSARVRLLTSLDAGATWEYKTPNPYIDTLTMFGFSKSATTDEFAAHSSVKFDFIVLVGIDKSSNLPISDTIAIDGLVTFELVYL